MKRFLTRMLPAIALAGLLATAAGAAVDTSRQWVPGEIIVKFRPGTPAAQKALNVGGVKVRDFRTIGAEHWRIGDKSVIQAVAALEANPAVEYVEPNYLLYALETPTDPRFGELWGLNNTGQLDDGGNAGVVDADIDAVEAWDVYTGSATAVVAVIDSGVDYTHPDLAANIWTNPGEIAGNGLDDDLNGFIDDIHGWDFANDDADPMDDNDHGTHCSGTIGGVANNGIGVAGVNWNVKIMGLKFLTSGGTGSTADAIGCIEYATLMGVDVMSNSWGGGGYDAALEAAIAAAYAADIFFVAAAGNSGSDNDATANYPSNYGVNNVIAVMATNNRDQRVVEPGWWSSSYGATTVDIAAPGLYILSTTPGNTYQVFSGTSMATPHVAGAMAMLRGRFPGISVDDGKNLLMTIGNDPVAALTGLCVTGARLNLLKLIGDPDEVPPGAVLDLAVGTTASNWLQLAWTAPGDDGNVGTASSYDIRHATSPIVDQAGWDAATQVTGEPDPAAYGSAETMRVDGLAASTTYYFSVRARDEYGNYGDFSNSPAGTTLAPPTIAVNPASLSASVTTGGTAVQTLTITNTGVGVLDFTIPTPAYVLPAKGARAAVPQHEYVELAKGGVDTRVGITGSGGPDAFGYNWIDSDSPGGPALNWIDISGLGTAVTQDDDTNMGPFSLGFTFPFYGQDYTSFRIGSNGYVTFLSSSTSGGNSALPSAGAPLATAALFWDDLIPSGGTCRYYNDGTRMIIQYSNWSNFNQASSYSMQMHLYPSGTIEYHYQSMSGLLSSATVGIQDHTGTDGLTVAFNTAYAHSGLAVRFASLPQWLAVNPASGSLGAGQSANIDVTFDGTGLCGSQFDATVHVLSNDPAAPDTAVPASIHLTGTPDIALAPTSLDFGEVYITATGTRAVAITNAGCADLVVGSLLIDSAEFTTTMATPFTVVAGDTVDVPVTFAPAAAGSRSGNLTIGSDDPDSPSLVVTLAGIGLDFPDIAVAPASLSETLPTGGSSTQQLVITNNGLGELDFIIPEAEFITLAKKAAKPRPGALPIDLAKDEPDPRVGAPVVYGAGGPDAYGYKWKDSDEPGGPAYNWIEISAIGTPIPFTGDDQNLGYFNIGFDFPFYGTAFSSFRAATNGFISFTNSSSTGITNYDLPSASAPENLIAPFWDDQDFRTSGDAFYHYDGQRLVIEYKDVPRYASGGPYSYQVHLYPSGRIEFHYQSMQGTRLNEATIGIQNETMDSGLAPAFNTAYVHDGMAIRFETQVPWVTATPAAGTVAPGNTAIVTVNFDAADLCGESYAANLHILSNDPDAPDVAVPVALTLTGSPDAQVAPATLAFGDVYLTQSRVLAAAVTNVGCASLEVTGLVIDNPAYTADVAAPFTVAPGATQPISVTFTPVAAGPPAGTLTLATSDPAHPQLVVALTGTGLANAGIVVTPSLLAVTVPPGQQRTGTIHLENTGAGALQFTVPSIELYNKAVADAKPAAPAVERPKGSAEEASGLAPLGSGGPDLFGYSWVDSDAPGGPAFGWVDIGDTGTPALTSGDDVTSAALPIGFTFRYYGVDRTTFRVCSNGWLSFTSNSTAYSNIALPSASAPLNMLAPFWDDINLSAVGSGDVFYQVVGGNLVVQWDGVMRYGTTVPISFQVILSPTGRITFQYLSLAAAVTNEATIGIQNPTGTIGLQVAHNAAYLHDNLAIRFSPIPEWASVSPVSGTIPAGEGADLTVTFDAAGLALGAHGGLLRILSNDLQNPVVQVPLAMTVQDYISGVGDVLPARLALAQNVPNPFNPATKIGFALPARGLVDLRVYDVRGALVRTLVAGELEAGFHDYTWAGLSDAGAQVPSGVYFYRLRTAGGDITRSMTLVK